MRLFTRLAIAAVAVVAPLAVAAPAKADCIVVLLTPYC